MFFEPANGIGGLPAVKSGLQFPRPAWITGGEFGGIETGVGDVAASTARDFYLGEEASSLLKKMYTDGRICFGGGDSGEEACGSAANDGDGVWMVGRHEVCRIGGMDPLR